MCVRSNPMPLEDMQAHISVDPVAGSILWLQPPRDLFSSYKAWRVSCARRFRRAALNSRHSRGYLHGYIAGRAYFAHIVVWAFANGRWPTGEIDHIDGNKTNNRIENLRECSTSENQRNQAIKKSNNSGVTGVHWHAQSRSWRAQVRHDGRTISLGLFKSIEEAAAARSAANIQYGYHANHGRAA
jgi:hypothetical protein